MAHYSIPKIFNGEELDATFAYPIKPPPSLTTLKSYSTSLESSAQPSVDHFKHEVQSIFRRLKFVRVLFVLTLLGFFLFNYLKNKAQTDTQEVLLVRSHLTELLSLLQDAETGQRGYLLTSDPDYLEPYHTSLARTTDIRGRLLSTTPDQAVSLQREQLLQFIDEKYRELARTIELHDTDRKEEALTLVKSDLGKNLMDQIRVEITTLKTANFRELGRLNDWMSSLDIFLTIFQIALLSILGYMVYGVYRVLQPITIRLSEDAAALKAQQQRLREKNEQLEYFAYIASHDLNEPLRTIHSFIDVIREDMEDKMEPEVEQHFGFIQKALVRMRTMIDGLLNYSRIGRSDEPQKVDLNEVIEKIRQDLHTTIEDHRATIHLTPMPTILCRRIEIRQLFQNLLTNALKFHRSGVDPEIRISAEEQPTEWEFCVADNGIGIEAEQQNKIFNIFTKLHRRDEYSGHGIGLAFCQKIVETHGGTIRVESEPGAGSRFYFTLPKT